MTNGESSRDELLVELLEELLVTLLDMAFFDKGLGKEKSVVRKDSTGMSFGSDGWADWPFFLGLKTRPGLAYAASSAV